MIIRGIDFARHTVVVGNDAESPTPGNAGQSALPPRGDVMARVIAVAGGEATLDINGQRVVVETHVALNAGDKLFVRVQEPANGMLRLSILASAPDLENGLPTLADPDLNAMLRDLEMPTDDRTRQAARALVARDGTLEKSSLKSLLTELKAFKQVTQREAGAAALLQKAGVPVNPATVDVVAGRAEPQAPPQLASKLASLAPALEALLRQVPARSPLTQQAQALLSTLQGLPLDENATNETVAAALKDWLGKLQPKTATEAARSVPRGAPAPGATATAARLPEAATGAGAIDEMLAVLDNEAAQAAEPAPAPPGGRPLARFPVAAEEQPRSEEGAQAPKQAMARAAGVPASQRDRVEVGITKAGPAPLALDLASQLEKLGRDLGTEHKALGHIVKEALAELHYTQLANGPGPAGATGQEYLVPLLLPQLSPEHPEGRLQVFQRAARKGEPIDPNNVRFVFVLETEHMQTVQADMSINDGQVDLTIGVPDAKDRDLLAGHIAELEQAIADLGWPTGRFGARQAKGLPPRVRQEEGLADVVRFDRRV